MELNGVEGYFGIKYLEDGRIKVALRYLDGAPFLRGNWAGLERLTLQGRQLRRVAGDPERYCTYYENVGPEQVQQQPQPTN